MQRGMHETGQNKNNNNTDEHIPIMFIGLLNGDTKQFLEGGYTQYPMICCPGSGGDDG